jgi:hypothetical protein
MGNEPLVAKVEETSVFHEGSNQIDRINELWKSAERYAFNGEFKLWKVKLDSMFRELSADIISLPDTQADIKYHEEGLDKELSQIERENKDNTRVLRNKTYKVLDKWERRIRTLQKLSGKGGKYYDANSDDFD